MSQDVTSATITGSQSHPRQMECLYAELGEARQAILRFLAAVRDMPLTMASIKAVAAKELEEMCRQGERS